MQAQVLIFYKFTVMAIFVNTAQNVSIEYQPAGVLNRIIATIIDWALLAGIILLVLVFAAGIKPLEEDAVWLIIFFTLVGLYHLLCEFFLGGRSIGKLTLQMRVVRLDGKKLTFWDCLLRWSLRLIDITINGGIIAIISILFTPKMQRLGDLAAGTTVICEKRPVTIQTLESFTPQEDHQVTFPQANLLSDKDITIVKEVLKELKRDPSLPLLEMLSQKIKDLTGIQTHMENKEFIETILKDYNYLAKQ